MVADFGSRLYCGAFDSHLGYADGRDWGLEGKSNQSSTKNVVTDLSRLGQFRQVPTIY